MIFTKVLYGEFSVHFMQTLLPAIAGSLAISPNAESSSASDVRRQRRNIAPSDSPSKRGPTSMVSSPRAFGEMRGDTAEKRIGHPRIGEGDVVELEEAGHHTFLSISKTGSGAVGEPPNTRAASRHPPRHFAALSQPSHIFGR